METVRPVTEISGRLEPARALDVKFSWTPLPRLPVWMDLNSTRIAPLVPRSDVAVADSKTPSSPARVMRMPDNEDSSISVLSSKRKTSSLGDTFKTVPSANSEPSLGWIPIKSGPASNCRCSSVSLSSRRSLRRRLRFSRSDKPRIEVLRWVGSLALRRRESRRVIKDALI